MFKFKSALAVAMVALMSSAAVAQADDRFSNHRRHDDRRHHDDRSHRSGVRVGFDISIVLGGGRHCPPPVIVTAPPCPPRYEPPCPPRYERRCPEPRWVEVEEVVCERVPYTVECWEDVRVPVYGWGRDHCGRRIWTQIGTRCERQLVRRTEYRTVERVVIQRYYANWSEPDNCYTYRNGRGDVCHYRR